MMLYPDVQAKAQKVLDDVVGRSRLPDFNDLDNLPYIRCLVKETLRWKAVTPLGSAPLLSMMPTLSLFSTGVPHYTTEASEYRG
jgi:cytochrome P450